MNFTDNFYFVSEERIFQRISLIRKQSIRNMNEDRENIWFDPRRDNKTANQVITAHGVEQK